MKGSLSLQLRKYEKTQNGTLILQEKYQITTRSTLHIIHVPWLFFKRKSCLSCLAVALVTHPLDIVLQGISHMVKEAVRSWINKNYNLLKAIGKQCHDSIL